jgi:uncharacterized protein YcbX
MGIELSGLYAYPVKSLQGLALPQAGVARRGLRWDRHWMVVDLDGRFVTQRQRPRMALIGCQVEGDRLRLSAPGMEDLELPAAPSRPAAVEVRIWNDRCLAASSGAQAAHWLSRFLDSDVQLVYLPGERVRPLDPTYARPEDQTGFADGFPFLLISEASLDDLNRRLERPLSMRRFRPNLVVSGCEPYAEDRWRRIRIGGIEFRVVKPCSRCIITTVDPQTGERAGDEPLRTLRSYRQRDNKVFFGQNLIHDNTGPLRLGDQVEVLDEA